MNENGLKRKKDKKRNKRLETKTYRTKGLKRERERIRKRGKYIKNKTS